VSYKHLDQGDQDDLFDRAFRKMTRGMEDHQFVHENVALGCKVYGKEHYYKLMKSRRMLPYDMAEDLAGEWDKDHPQKEYGDLSPKARDIITSLKLTADSKGNIILGNRAIKALQEIGAMPASLEHAPTHHTNVGGFN
jgi:hypothetical protein